MESQGRNFAGIKDAICREVQAVKDPGELMIMLTHGMTMYAPMRACMEAGVFRFLVDRQCPVTIDELTTNALQLTQGVSKGEPGATCTSDQTKFVQRMLSAVCACKLVDEVKPRVYLANDMTRSFTDEGSEGGFKLIFDNAFGPRSSSLSLMDWMKKSSYTSPMSAAEGPFQEARGIVGRTAFQYWAQDDLDSLINLSTFMKRVQRDRLNWSAWFPTPALFDSTSSQDGTIFMVDIGGNLGHDLSAFAARYPDRSLRLVLQDLPPVVEEARREHLDARIEFTAHSFFDPQPIRHASIYFLHKILHDWPDRDCVAILQHVRDAMGPRSRIFINEVILPDKDSPFTLAAFDMTMLLQVSGKERTESMWRELVGSVGGLSIANIWMSPNMLGEDVLEIIREQ